MAVVLFAAGCGEPADEQASRVFGLDGSPVDVRAGEPPVTVLLFVRTDCPISNRYAPTVREIMSGYGGEQARLWIVYVDPDETVDQIRQHMSEYDLPGTPVRDLYHDLVALTGATITPEVAVFPAGRGMVYRGRIDDRYVAFGKARAAPTRNDLRDALTAVLDGRAIAEPTTQAVGCFITDLKPIDSAEGA